MARNKPDRTGARSERPPGSARARAELAATLERMRDDYILLDADDPGRPDLLLKIGGILVSLSDPDIPVPERTDEEESVDLLALETLGARYTTAHQYLPALECYFECVRMLDRHRDPTMLGAAWMEIGALYGEMGMLDRALECFRESIARFREGGNYYLEVRAIVNVGNILLVQGQYEAALTSMIRCLMVFEELGERAGIAEALAGIGSAYERMGETGAALSYTERALAMLSEEENPALAGAVLLSLGELYLHAGRLDESVAIIDRGFALAARIGDDRLRARLHEAASHARERLGDPILALHHHRSFVRIDREYRAGRGHAGIAELEMRFEIERVRRERNAYREQAQELRQEVYAKTRELTSLSLNLVQKSEFLEEMRRQLAQIIGTAHDGSTSMVKPLLDDLATAIKADNGWALFEDRFNEEHRDFVRALAERFPSLTPTELKICALTRSDLSTKEIASLLFVSVRNVQNHRYRIRKKFGLDPEANLVSFLAAL